MLNEVNSYVVYFGSMVITLVTTGGQNFIKIVSSIADSLMGDVSDTIKAPAAIIDDMLSMSMVDQMEIATLVLTCIITLVKVAMDIRMFLDRRTVKLHRGTFVERRSTPHELYTEGDRRENKTIKRT